MQTLVRVKELEREVKVGRQNRGFGNECCSHENYSFSLSSRRSYASFQLVAYWEIEIKIGT